MDIASMVLGIVSLVFSFLCGCVSIITAPIGLVLGIVDLVKKRDKQLPKGMAIAGVIMCGISVVLLIVLMVIAISTGTFIEEFNSIYYGY